MLFKSNKSFDLKSIREISYPKIDLTEKMCDYTVKY